MKPKWLPPVERFAHFMMGFGARLVYLDLLLWRREADSQWPPATTKLPAGWVDLTIEDAYIGYARIYWRQTLKEFAEGKMAQYVSAERVKDMLDDMKWYMIGATCAEPFRWALVGFLIWKYAG